MPSEIAFLALGDIHLDSCTWRKVKAVYGDGFRALESMAETAKSLNVPIVLVGDVFDVVNPPTEIVSQFRQIMATCRKAGIKVYAIQGNHDKTSPPWYSAVDDWPIHIGDGKPVDINGISCLGFDYAIKDDITYYVKNVYKPADCLFLHQAVKQVLDFDGAWNLDLNEVPKLFKLIIMGDIHKTYEFDLGHVKAYYTGASHARSLDEIGGKSCIAVHRDITISRIPIAYREIKTFSVTDDDSLNELEAWLNSVNPEYPILLPLAWVYSVPEFVVAASNLQTKFQDKIIYVQPVVDGESAKRIKLSADKGVTSLVDLLSRVVNADVDPELHSLCLQLLDKGADPMDVLGRFYDRFKADWQPK